MTKKILTFILFLCVLSVNAQRNIPFNSYWNYGNKNMGAKALDISLPRSWNEDYAFRVDKAQMPTDTVRYIRTFMAPKSWKDKKIYIEFEGIRQEAQVWLNGFFLGRHTNGINAFGYDLTPYVNIGKANVLEVLTDNMSKHGKMHTAAVDADMCYGGISENVRMHVVDKLHQTLPLYSSLGSMGTYVYATDADINRKSAVINVESEVRNESDRTRTVNFCVEIKDRDGHKVASFQTVQWTIGKGQTQTLKASALVNGLHWWSWGYGYLYTVTSRLVEGSKTIDEVNTVTGFRTTDYNDGALRINGHIYDIRGFESMGNDWPGVGIGVPAWMSDYSNGLLVECGGNMLRWMNEGPTKQDIESCDRMGLPQIIMSDRPYRDMTMDEWQLRLNQMRDVIIYNRNNPSVLCYECGHLLNGDLHLIDMTLLRNQYDPQGGRIVRQQTGVYHQTTDIYGPLRAEKPMFYDLQNQWNAKVETGLESPFDDKAGTPIYLVMGIMTRDCGMQGDGADMALVEVEVADEDYNRCTKTKHMVHFEIDGPIEWLGGIGTAEEGAVYHDANGRQIHPADNPTLIRSVDLPAENGVVRVLVRSTGKHTGKAHVHATSTGLVGAKTEIVLKKKATPLRGSLLRGEQH